MPNTTAMPLGVLLNLYNSSRTPTIRSIPDSASSVLGLPGKTLEKITDTGKEPENTPLRTYDDLKAQFFGPTIFNKQRLWELGDTALYQGSYMIPGALAGGFYSGPAGAYTGLALGKLLGGLHYLKKERARQDVAKKEFNKDERELMDRISKGSRNYGILGALTAGLGAAGISALLKQDRFGRHATPALVGAGGALTGQMIGSLLGQHLAKINAKKQKRFADIINKYS